MKVKNSMFDKLFDTSDGMLVALECQGYVEEIDKNTTAQTMGCTARYPTENEIFCDLDTDEQLAAFLLRFDFLQEILDEYTFTKELMSSRNGNTHAVVTVMPEITQEVRLMVQSMLGSDPKREMLGLMRYLRTGEANDCLFRPLEGGIDQG